MWIPAYYRDEPLSGLMRTTSRSESENQFFGLVLNSQLTLVEFFSHFDMALETQRYAHRKNDHDTINTKPGELLTDVIPLALWKMDRMQKSKLKIEKLLEKVSFSCRVYVIVADNNFSASCSCKSVFEIDEIPKKYILRRWTRDAVSNKSKCSIFGKDVANGNTNRF
ncbi:protein FAR1-RELATED SEQUENCE 12-like [Bidens hawaiensis]|uniref:protein FAR1-RELATED SEQUENCE 12-like n=1 Tax=Bidens hawaiensis TaxID=980011 RepID=UPI004049B51C